MKRILMLMLAAAVVMPQTVQAKKKTEDRELKVMSYNMRVGDANDGTNSWKYRCPATALMLQDQKPDVFGVQEAFDYQVQFITDNCREYKTIGVGREDGKKKGEHMNIFWNKNTVKVLKWGTFWLSETPDKPSKGWDARCKRSATWALMKDKATGRKFYFINTHLDHKGVEARREGLKLIADRIGSINPKGYPMVLTGDFNVRPDNPALKSLEGRMECTRTIAKKTDDLGTYNGWGKRTPFRILDYIYVSGFGDCIEYQTVVKPYADRTYVSDHFPIISVLTF